MSAAIKVENLSKAYQLGEIGTGTISRDLERWFAKVRGKEDPFLKIGETNDRAVKGSSDLVWSLKDINFEIQQGDAVGIIGRNGAGKSTLLKILSRVTSPTTGTVKAKGRIASLLEVGTGFHPELTGRENIFLNGAILGMRKREIARKFDKIVDFSGVERYIDTPVKRYSSGMYVRLAFAVAAHLESEILIVDEVLAVGDAEFQKKCLGKMGEVSKGEGRTVLFVSHNMTAIKNLCNSVIYMNSGVLLKTGETETVVNFYLSDNYTNKTSVVFNSPDEAPGNEKVRIKKFEVIPHKIDSPITINTSLDVKFDFWNFEKDAEINLSMHVYTISQECIFNIVTEAKKITPGVYSAVCNIPSNFLNDGIYSVSMMIVAEKSYAIYNFENMVTFEVQEDREVSSWHGKWAGFVRPTFPFSFEQINLNALYVDMIHSNSKV